MQIYTHTPICPYGQDHELHEVRKSLCVAEDALHNCDQCTVLRLQLTTAQETLCDTKAKLHQQRIGSLENPELPETLPQPTTGGGNDTKPNLDRSDITAPTHDQRTAAVGDDGDSGDLRVALSTVAQTKNLAILSGLTNQVNALKKDNQALKASVQTLKRKGLEDITAGALKLQTTHTNNNAQGSKRTKLVDMLAGSAGKGGAVNVEQHVLKRHGSMSAVVAVYVCPVYLVLSYNPMRVPEQHKSTGDYNSEAGPPNRGPLLQGRRLFGATFGTKAATIRDKKAASSDRARRTDALKQLDND
ncbi:hypothetical protein SARC_04322 [Sphaeroforma arctica JP610]|uniref:Uncharacterized protein n=1 Tax=Sphaeroforma arctica JP610 TaxID=667725 RepID=A0A0L0G2X7_9EUKA|nr:hypothetical protein SARC_04322 [Sphaeroforma arctica JP610]KNC83435.1 hypothetical protein SARC_04322 [Sphaeroforma arctica JP610]|eukprot:XP_014157337.1 hypothetical protein SARC_04322 [Sphaeroforma arctica JP610]